VSNPVNGVSVPHGLPHDLEALPARVASRIVVTDTGCWQWTGSIEKPGYGMISHPGGVRPRNERVHRYVYRTLVGPIPDGLPLDHLCRNRACCNPAHLEPVTPRVNSHRSIGNAWQLKAAKTVCVRGHDLTDPDNVIVRMRNGRPNRRCAACREIEIQQTRARERERKRSR